MIKPDNCSICNSDELRFELNKEVFNPDTDEYDIHDCWICELCNTIHVYNVEYSFFMKEITDKETQMIWGTSAQIE